jgi:beta-galactosidase
LQPGDNVSWANPSFPDTNWISAKGGDDWRLYGLPFQAINATGWYRQHVVVPDSLRNSTAPVLLSLGIIAGSSSTYLNGKLLGSSPGAPLPSTRDYITPIVYPIPNRTLLPGDTNVVAVKVVSFGGASSDKPKFMNGSFPGGLYDDPLLGNHDVRVGPYDPAASPGAHQQAYTLGGIGWYRKSFIAPPTSDSTRESAKRVFIKFDGVYMNSDIYVNGLHAGNWIYGYTTFEFDITPFVTTDGSPNVIAVRVANLGVNSRWYAGSGIYRHTWLSVRDPVYVPTWGVQVSTPDIVLTSPGVASSASVSVNVTVNNTDMAAAAITRVAVDLRLAASGAFNGGSCDRLLTIQENVHTENAVASMSTLYTNVTVPPGTNATVTLTANLTGDALHLWSTSAPALYVANATATSRLGAKVYVDSSSVQFGIRKVSFDSANGLLLNGVSVNMWGGCCHHDNGPLGAMAIDRADERRVENLKKLGYNAIRTSHNPASPAFLDACDRLGVLVMAEAFDGWAQGKNPDDYHKWFWDWWQKDFKMMILRDRNHPSIVMWSIGNEIPMRFTRTGDTLAAEMCNLTRQLDPDSGRATTSGYPFFNDQDSPFLHLLDVPGYNYAGIDVYAKDHKKLPNRTMVGTESVAQDTMRMYGYVSNMSWVVGDFIWSAIDCKCTLDHVCLLRSHTQLASSFPFLSTM